jgi:hypothetical protein
MCQKELSFSLEIIKKTQKGSLRSSMSILFDESDESSGAEEVTQFE